MARTKPKLPAEVALRQYALELAERGPTLVLTAQERWRLLGRIEKARAEIDENFPMRGEDS